ncbi:TPA: immunoglobulin-like domain-containing protein, partial [Enterococcus faecium]
VGDNVEVVIFDKNYQEIGRQKVTIEEQVATKLTLDPYTVGKSSTITGSYNGTNGVFLRAEVNGEKKALVSSKDLAQGKINYYIGKDLKTGDNVEVVIFDKNYQEIGRQKVTIEEQVAQNNSIRLNLKGKDCYLYVENGFLVGDGVGRYVAITKNGKPVSQINNSKSTKLRVGDIFTIEPMNDAVWDDQPVTDRPSLGNSFNASYTYTFKVNNDGSVSFVKSELHKNVVARSNSIHLTFKDGLASLYVEKGILCVPNCWSDTYLNITKNGKVVSRGNAITDKEITDLKAGDIFTIQPLEGSVWKDEPEKSLIDRPSLGEFDCSHVYTFKVNEDGSISFVESCKV